MLESQWHGLRRLCAQGRKCRGQLAGVNQVQVLFATEKLVVMPTMTFVHKLNLRCKKRAIPAR